MNDIARSGRTILFVSHNLTAVERLCSQCIAVSGGRIFSQGTPADVIDTYVHLARSEQKIALKDRRDRTGSGRARAVSFFIKDSKGRQVKKLKSGGSYTFTIGCENVGAPLSNVVASLTILDDKENRILMFRSTFTKDDLALGTAGNLSCSIDHLPLANGTYSCSIFLSHADEETLDWVEHAAPLVVEGGDFFGTGSMGLPLYCKVLTVARWSSEAATASDDDRQSLTLEVED
jgi:lipopolysaccharide transport system ATP-binding protein